jgi:hypothetical protein
MDPVTPRSRRAVLAGALGGVAAAAASSLIRPSTVAADTTDPIIIGVTNTASSQTTLTNSAVSGTTFSIVANNVSGTTNGVVATANGTGTALVGTSSAGRGLTASTATGIAVRATASGAGFGMWASSTTGIGFRATSGGQAADISTTSASVPSLVSKATGGTVGVVGLGGSFTPEAYPDGVGVLGDNPDAAGVGVWGRSTSGTALLGDSDSGYGLEGYGAVGVYASGGSVGVLGDVDAATGVQGWTGVATAPDSGSNVGVWAGAENGRTALQTQGVVRMNRSGKTTIAVGTSSKKVTVPGGITATSLGFANIQANRSGFYIRGVAMGTADSSITIYLNASATTTAITVAWVVIG